MSSSCWAVGWILGQIGSRIWTWRSRTGAGRAGLALLRRRFSSGVGTALCTFTARSELLLLRVGCPGNTVRALTPRIGRAATAHARNRLIIARVCTAFDAGPPVHQPASRHTGYQWGTTYVSEAASSAWISATGLNAWLSELTATTHAAAQPTRV